MTTLLEAKHLRVGMGSPQTGSMLLDEVTFAINAGQTVALIGESGSGKSITAKTLIGLLPHQASVWSGSVCWRKENMQAWTARQWQSVRGSEIALLFQDSQGAFDPLYRIGDHFRELFRVHGLTDRREAKEHALRLLGEMRLDDPARVYDSYPHELSGGMKQRVMLALAVALDPSLLIADEPTTALDKPLQAEILREMKAWQKRTGAAILFITHDLEAAAQIADDLVVIHQGRTVETGEWEQIIARPTHPHTRHLVWAWERWRLLETKQPRVFSAPLLEAEKLCKTYVDNRLWGGGGRTTVLDEVSLQIGQGEIVGLLGESGSGKSTLSRLLLQIERPDRGRVHWMGPIARQAIQWVQQEPIASFEPRWTVEQIVGEGLLDAGLRPAERKARVLSMLEKVGLPHDIADARPHELSGGMGQRVALARAMIVNPQLVILDEPFASLDLLHQMDMLELLAAWNRQQHVSFLFITHDIRAALAFCDRILIMSGGRIVDELSSERIADELSGGQIDSQRAHEYTIRLVNSLSGGWQGRMRVT